MQRLPALSRATCAMQVRFGSSGAVPQYSSRWANLIRSQSNIHTPEDPPRATLPENHEAWDGTSDFSNWVDKHEDISTVQAVTGLLSAVAVVSGIYLLAQHDRKTKTPAFTKRELPTVEADIPTMAIKHYSRDD